MTSPLPASARFLAALIMLAILGIIAGARYVSPNPQGLATHESLGLRPCLSLRWAGVPCPACGGTTAFVLMAHGRFGEALLTSPLGSVVFLVSIVMLIPLLRIVTGRPSPVLSRILTRPAILVPPSITIALVSWLVVILRLYIGN